MIEDHLGRRLTPLSSAERVWEEIELFCIIVDNDVTNLGCLWQPKGRIANGYYVPDEHDTTYRTITIDTPPKAV